MPEQLTQQEQQVYHYLLDFLAENTYQPSIRDIAKQFGIKSTKTVSDILHALSRKGFIERDRARSRGVRLIGYSTRRGPTVVLVAANPTDREIEVGPDDDFAVLGVVSGVFRSFVPLTPSVPSNGGVAYGRPVSEPVR